MLVRGRSRFVPVSRAPALCQSSEAKLTESLRSCLGRSLFPRRLQGHNVWRCDVQLLRRPTFPPPSRIPPGLSCERFRVDFTGSVVEFDRWPGRSEVKFPLLAHFTLHP